MDQNKAASSDTLFLQSVFHKFDVRHNKEKYQIDIPPIVEKHLKFASVLIPLFYQDGEWHVLLTVRAKHLKQQPGQVSFPGGKWEEGDTDAVATAEREAKEEIGLNPADVTVIAVLASNIVRPNILVTPVVALIPRDFQPDLDKQEVEKVFSFPLKRFLSSEQRTVQTFSVDDSDRKYYVYHFIQNIDGKAIDVWGFTASLCVQSAMVVLQSNLSFCLGSEQTVNKDNCFQGTNKHFFNKEVISKYLSKI